MIGKKEGSCLRDDGLVLNHLIHNDHMQTLSCCLKEANYVFKHPADSSKQ